LRILSSRPVARELWLDLSVLKTKRRSAILQVDYGSSVLVGCGVSLGVGDGVSKGVTVGDGVVVEVGDGVGV
jgi:hypothetical protein